MIKLYSAWFCPYAQRAWLTLEFHKIPFEYVESMTVNKNQLEGNHGYDKIPRLLELNPKGQVPTLEMVQGGDSIVDIEEIKKDERVKRINDSTIIVTESIVCMEILNSIPTKDKQDLIPDTQLLTDAKKFDQCICSVFYKILMKPTMDEQKDAFILFANGISDFLKEIDDDGFYKSSPYPTIVDFTVIPWLLRIPIVKHYRPTFQLDEFITKEDMEKLEKYVNKMKSLSAVKKTLWDDHSAIIEVYRRYAEGTAESQVGQAVRNGKNAHDA